MKANKQMRELLGQVGREPAAIPDGLNKIISGGFIAAEGCIFLSLLYRAPGNATLEMFPDRTGYECFVNHIHIDDYTSLDKALAVALRVMEDLGKAWTAQHGADPALQFIISLDETSCVFRFHVVREHEEWLMSDLEQYASEAALTCGSAEADRATWIEW